jgi:hypothetical protein
MNKMICFILSLTIIILIFIVIKQQQQQQQQQVNKIKEQWLDVNMNSFAPMFDTLKFSGLNITKLSNGFHLEDDDTKCVCQCNRKCKPSTHTTTTSTTPTPIPTVNLSMGNRINFYPWFVPNAE